MYSQNGVYSYVLHRNTRYLVKFVQYGCLCQADFKWGPAGVAKFDSVWF